ncbi:MAG: acyl-CoA thioesterase [Planctomycetota bacterium]|nr:acyl-CoA thioesterase [Planctomycetota bacterium]
MPTNDGFEMTLRVVPMPRDTNHLGTIFGGYIMSLVDQAAFAHAQRITPSRWATRAVEKLEFHSPVRSGDIVTLFTKTEREGRTSLSIRVRVEAECHIDVTRAIVTEGVVTMVALDQNNRPRSWKVAR